jgi:hypothetical protein
MERSLHRALVIAKYLIFKVGSLGASGRKKTPLLSIWFFVKGRIGGLFVIYIAWFSWVSIFSSLLDPGCRVPASDLGGAGPFLWGNENIGM